MYFNVLFTFQFFGSKLYFYRRKNLTVRALFNAVVLLKKHIYIVKLTISFSNATHKYTCIYEWETVRRGGKKKKELAIFIRFKTFS
jgi:hypothetical protein